MSDLIDLSSSNVKGLINSKLLSPLIPVPGNIESNEQTNSLVTKKPENLGSNPFDNVLHETTEYVRKKGDPFEVMLQKALKYKSDEGTELKTQLVTFKDDFTPKRRKKFLKSINKTLDEFLIEDKFSSVDKEKKEESVSLVTSNTDVCDSNSAKEKYSSFKEFVVPKNSICKPHFDLQRSLSQGNRKSPIKLQDPDRRSQSITDSLKIASQSDSTVLSYLNIGFLESKQTISSGLSDVSSMARSNSVSLVSNLSSISPKNIVNYILLDSNCVKKSNERINTAENSTEIKSVQCDLSDLIKRCTLSYAINRTTSALSLKEEPNQSNSMKRKDSKLTMDDKLIDVDVFVLEQSFKKEHNKSINSTSSSDSVFIDNSNVNKLILNEAKELSRIFEELSIRTNSVSSIDDLLSNDTLWMSELLPAFEDESVDNLIELPVSPKKKVKDGENNDLKQSPASTDNAEKNLIKDIESQFTDCVPIIRQKMVTTLLSDLKKLVKTENNSEASKLINDLESVLGVRYKNNTELLASLNISKELQTSEMPGDKLDNTEESDKISACVNKSQKENREVSYKEKFCDNGSSLPHINHKLGDMSHATIVSNDNSLTKSSLYNNNKNSVNITISSKAALNTSLSNEKDEQLAVELLVNLGKLLSGQAEDSTILQLLKNIGKALNIACNNCKSEDKLQIDGKSCNTERIMALETSESEHNVHLADATETTQEQSLNFKFKQKTSRKSISAVHSSNVNTSNMQVKAQRKNTSGLKDQKRFSSQTGLYAVANKRIPFSGTSNMRIVKTVELNDKNEKPLAIINVKNKLKKKSDTVSKKGPIKAIHPANSMQKKVSLGKRTAPSPQVITPPKSKTTASFGSKIISSTPNSMASSTSSDQTDETSKTQLKSTDKKRNFSCDISPVTRQGGNSPRRPIQPPPAKICTPKRQRADSSGIPKYCTPPRKLNSSLDMSSHHQQSPQNLNKSLTNYQQYSPIHPKSAEKRPQNLLKESNKFLTKTKPFKLISKLKENTTNDFTEKENCFE